MPFAPIFVRVVGRPAVLAAVLLVGSVLSPVSALTDEELSAILDRFNAELADHEDSCGYRIGDGVWAIGASIEKAADTVVGEYVVFEAGEELGRPFELAQDGLEIALEGSMRKLFLRRSDTAGAVSCRVLPGAAGRHAELQLLRQHLSHLRPARAVVVGR